MTSETTSQSNTQQRQLKRTLAQAASANEEESNMGARMAAIRMRGESDVKLMRVEHVIAGKHFVFVEPKEMPYPVNPPYMRTGVVHTLHKKTFEVLRVGEDKDVKAYFDKIAHEMNSTTIPGQQFVSDVRQAVPALFAEPGDLLLHSGSKGYEGGEHTFKYMGRAKPYNRELVFKLVSGGGLDVLNDILRSIGAVPEHHHHQQGGDESTVFDIQEIALPPSMVGGFRKLELVEEVSHSEVTSDSEEESWSE